MQKPTLLVLAAGMGSRYGGLKQIDPMGPSGETILDYSVYDAIQAGFGKVVFVIREDFEAAFRESVGARFAERIAVDYAFQRLDDIPEGFVLRSDREKPWGTAHAIRAARHAIHEPFAVINADDFYGRDAYLCAARFLAEPQESATYGLIGYYLRNTLSEHGGVNRGVAAHNGELLTDVEEIMAISRREDGSISGQTATGDERPLAEDTIVSMNCWGFPAGFFAQLEECFTAFLEAHSANPKAECYIPSVVDELVSNRRANCRVLATTSSWFGVTYPNDKPHVVATLRDLVEKGEYPSPLV